MGHDDTLLRSLLLVLTNSPQPNAVARALAGGTLRAFRVHSLTIHALIDDELELRGQTGLSNATARLATRIPLTSATPEAHVARLGVPLRAAHATLEADFALLAHWADAAGGALVVVPLLHEARPIGVLSIGLDTTAGEQSPSTALLEGAAAALALWLLSDNRTAAAPPAVRPLHVSNRQRSILDGMRRGLTNGAIAAELGFSLGTIKADITALSALLGAHGREDLLRKAARAGFGPSA